MDGMKTNSFVNNAQHGALLVVNQSTSVNHAHLTQLWEPHLTTSQRESRPIVSTSMN